MQKGPKQSTEYICMTSSEVCEDLCSLYSQSTDPNPTEHGWDVTEQEIHIVDVQLTHLQQPSDDIMELIKCILLLWLKDEHNLYFWKDFTQIHSHAFIDKINMRSQAKYSYVQQAIKQFRPKVQQQHPFQNKPITQYCLVQWNKRYGNYPIRVNRKITETMGQLTTKLIHTKKYFFPHTDLK